MSLNTTFQSSVHHNNAAVTLNEWTNECSTLGSLCVIWHRQHVGDGRVTHLNEMLCTLWRTADLHVSTNMQTQLIHGGEGGQQLTFRQKTQCKWHRFEFQCRDLWRLGRHHRSRMEACWVFSGFFFTVEEVVTSYFNCIRLAAMLFNPELQKCFVDLNTSPTPPSACWW